MKQFSMVFLMGLSVAGQVHAAERFKTLECSSFLDGDLRFTTKGDTLNLVWEASTHEIFALVRQVASKEIPDDLILGHDAVLKVTLPMKSCEFGKSGVFSCRLKGDEGTYSIKTFKNFSGNLTAALIESRFTTKHRKANLEIKMNMTPDVKGPKAAALSSPSFIVEDHWGEDNPHKPECKVNGAYLYGKK